MKSESWCRAGLRWENQKSKYLVSSCEQQAGVKRSKETAAEIRSSSGKDFVYDTGLVIHLPYDGAEVGYVMLTGKDMLNIFSKIQWFHSMMLWHSGSNAFRGLRNAEFGLTE